ncbi:MAG: membrane protein insertion efficiency factor YidD [Proteobacteria bacterium]|nr:membrane protein insertion efficiency factor YidD [Pseudomonadota bacterium]NDC25215.1 membrane protein insertion efficiency factor YidD [Pseudomonadota bacterium]
MLLTLRHGVHALVSVGSCCRFEPTCSRYGMQAIEIHGVLVGAGLLIKRLLKCHPWGKGGLDLVPTKVRGWRN